MTKAVLTVVDPSTNNAGPKAKEDASKILSQHGYLQINLPYNLDSKVRKAWYTYIEIPRLIRHQRGLTELVLQYPIYSRPLMDALINNYHKDSRGRLIFLVHDLESLRLFTDDQDYLKREIDWLNQADGLIVHTPAMVKWLRDHGVIRPMVPLQLFDYLNPQPIVDNLPYRQTVGFAGNLAKSSFLERVNFEDLRITAFGPNPAANYPAAVNYDGIETPEDLPKRLRFNYGLVWDGASVVTCEGPFGEYMKYNSPHKVSLYLSTGLPVIIWRQAAVASFIEDHQLGIAIDHLSDLEETLSHVDTMEYDQMKANVLTYAKRLRAGENLRDALAHLEKQL